MKPIGIPENRNRILWFQYRFNSNMLVSELTIQVLERAVNLLQRIEQFFTKREASGLGQGQLSQVRDQLAHGGDLHVQRGQVVLRHLSYTILHGLYFAPKYG